MNRAADPRTVAAMSELMTAIARSMDLPIEHLEFTICRPRDVAVESESAGEFGECERRGCVETAVGFDDDGEALCQRHLYEVWSNPIDC